MKDFFCLQANTCNLVPVIKFDKNILNLDTQTRYVRLGYLKWKCGRDGAIWRTTYLITPLEGSIGSVFRLVVDVYELRYTSFLDIFCIALCLIPV